jgi:hypothetical protein
MTCWYLAHFAPPSLDGVAAGMGLASSLTTASARRRIGRAIVAAVRVEIGLIVKAGS